MKTVHVILYLNNGNGDYSSTGKVLYSRPDSSVINVSTIVMGDVDNDGDLDFILGASGLNSAQNKLFLNDGQGDFSVSDTR